MKETDVQLITPLYIFVNFNHLTSLHWSQTLPDDDLDLSNQFSGKNATFPFFSHIVAHIIKYVSVKQSCAFALSTSCVFYDISCFHTAQRIL